MVEPVVALLVVDGSPGPVEDPEVAASLVGASVVGGSLLAVAVVGASLAALLVDAREVLPVSLTTSPGPPALEQAATIRYVVHT